MHQKTSKLIKSSPRSNSNSKIPKSPILHGRSKGRTQHQDTSKLIKPSPPPPAFSIGFFTASEEQTSLSSLGGAHMFLRLQRMALTRERNQDTTPIGQNKK
ncbi:hypothetical protein LOK49_LG03G01007 [Camellia lanceoleosa]|uniref:Uncharacterized protein n=1 Tax=Camellia lanceoleosa TaxID=1840588 RepID=A0ACC0IAA5_9ERIC|nr:hypothetical protein LOK49_LG03G01007 [Camellia lanceoleosa]